MTDQTGSSNSQSRNIAVTFSSGGTSSGSGDSNLLWFKRVAATGDKDSDERTMGTRVPLPRAATSHAIQRSNALLLKCVETLDGAIGDTDAILRATSVAQFKDHLTRLWQMRGEREAEFAEFVNMLQMLLCTTESPDGLDDNQLAAIVSVLHIAHDAEEFDDQLNNDLTTRLIQGGLRVFGELT
jgi:hypothetical protein